MMQWKALSDTEREPYEDLAHKDKQRYEDECAVRRYYESLSFLHSNGV